MDKLWELNGIRLLQVFSVTLEYFTDLVKILDLLIIFKSVSYMYKVYIDEHKVKFYFSFLKGTAEHTLNTSIPAYYKIIKVRQLKTFFYL